MENIININALRKAMESGMSSATIHNWLDDTISMLRHYGEGYPTERYIIIDRQEIDKVKQTLKNEVATDVIASLFGKK